VLRTRVIPTLLLRDGGLVKGERFKNHRYVGDPINAVKIFNEKEVDELVFLDIGAGKRGSGPNFELLRDIASEAFMPFGYGGGITKIKQIEKLFQLGVEKVVINSAAMDDQLIIREASRIAGSQSIVVSIDIRKSLLGGMEVYTGCGKKRSKLNPVDYAKQVEDMGAGELLLCSIDREGTGKGYDLASIKAVANSVSIPVVASGGAGSLDDFKTAVTAGASAVAAGRMFVFHGKLKGVLITYPQNEQLANVFDDNSPRLSNV
jgi:imidazole glycerol-phosphate synthase subunit HisF